jgi:hypothetical protein
MSKIRKLTPAVLKRIIAEEKQKIAKSQKAKSSAKINESAVDAVTKLALQEIKVLLEAKRIRRKRNALKRRIEKRMK